MTRTYIETYYAIPKLITRSKQKKHPKNCISQEKHKRDQINQPILPPLALKSDYCSLNPTLFVRLTEQNNFLSENGPDRARFIGFCHLRR